MKAYVCRRYGGPVELADVEKPAPRDGKVLVKVLATTVTAADWRVRTLEMPPGLGLFARLALGLRGPRQPIFGTEIAGVVDSVGEGVTRFRPGDEVFAFPGARMGGHAQYRVMPADGAIARKPEGLSFEEAASLSFGGTTALHFLRKADVKPGEAVLVIGASGGVGTAFVQLARHVGAVVTGVTSARNAELVASLGAAAVLDYARDDFAAGNATFDVIVDAVGASSFARCRGLLRENGRFVAIAGGLPEMLAAARGGRADGSRVVTGPAEERPEDVRRLAELAASGALRPVIDRRYAFAQMPEAHAYVATRRKRGSVVVSVDHEA